jgi:hypothetical protein
MKKVAPLSRKKVAPLSRKTSGSGSRKLVSTRVYKTGLGNVGCGQNRRIAEAETYESGVVKTMIRSPGCLQALGSFSNFEYSEKNYNHQSSRLLTAEGLSGGHIFTGF